MENYRSPRPVFQKHPHLFSFISLAFHRYAVRFSDPTSPMRRTINRSPKQPVNRPLSSP
ncbi:hypothetical protein MARPO_1581s0001 [Marchantia polymorpha]|uniref:Uncharacterized protein n=1 Tax=Marchantia polymorpha TaxID=3197 RepID=A0A2R6VXY5_MARPO|nr:hypothetical protein MARPO_1581s0001 [Marchantia polymorpha]|eukprot:PTQ26456.1 hypothetical protein MARPO_1581s0001 [Marchantia polymorpha]